MIPYDDENDAEIFTMITDESAKQSRSQDSNQSDEALSKANRAQTPTPAAAQGDIVKIDLRMTPENGWVAEPLFDTHGIVTFVLGWGNYLPGLHQLVEGCRAGDEVQNISVDAGWGERRNDLIFQVPYDKLSQILARQSPESSTYSSISGRIKVGASLTLPGNIDVMIKEIRDQDSLVILDANPPLAGSSYSCSFRVLEVLSPPPLQSGRMEYSPGDCSTANSPAEYEIATFALGCFWGAELAFLRQPGVVGTQVGYTQGTTQFPTYEQVSAGKTKHREALMVVYDASVVSYDDLMCLAVERLEQTVSPMELHQLFQHDDDEEEETSQYKYGFFFHTDAQRASATEFLDVSKNGRFGIELLPASVFYKAEEDHQQYLLKGGQSAKKGSKETIRCFG